MVQVEGAGFGVYQHAAISSALSAMSVRPSRRDITVIVALSLLSASLFSLLTFRSEVASAAFVAIGISEKFATVAVRAAQAVLTLFFALSLSALHKAISLQAAADASIAVVASKNQVEASSNMLLTRHQQSLLGLSGSGNRKSMLSKGSELVSELKSLGDIRLRPSRMNASPSKPASSPPHALMVPLHPVQTKGNRSTSATDSGFLSLLAGPVSSMSPASTLTNPKSSYSSQGSPFTTPSFPTGSPIEHRTTPWSRQKSFNLKDDVQSEEKLKKFLSDTDTKMIEAAGKTALSSQGFMTPPPTIRGVATNAPTSPAHTPVSLSTPRGTPVRTLRMSPSQKGITPPKKGENELPSPMSLDEVTERLNLLGVLPYIDQWRDALRQWFSEFLLNPLVYKINSSHLQVMAAVGKLGQSVTVSPVGGALKSASADGVTSEWNPAASDEESLLHQLRAALLQARDAPPAPQPGLFGLQSSGQEQRIVNPLVQECLDAVTEHQRLRLLMKGEWFKGLLPLSSVRPEAVVQRIKELAEGSCVKRYDFSGSGGDSKNPNPELPSDPHLLLYLFCALLEHPQWMLHVDQYAHLNMQTGTNPLFLNALPGNERIGEKHVAVISNAPGTVSGGACILAVGKQCPPVFALYWDKKLQFSLQGRTALWDAILLLCHRIKVAHGGVVRGISLSSPSYNLSPVLEPLR